MNRRTYVKGVVGTLGVPAISTGAKAFAPSESSRTPTELLDGDDHETVTEFLESHVAAGTFPGATVAIVDGSGIAFRTAVGKAELEPETRDVAIDTVFDLASVTKTVATATAVVQLVDRGALRVRDPIHEFFDDLTGNKREITVEHLLTHTSGYPAWAPLWQDAESPDGVIDHVLREISLEAEPGTSVTYSDLGFVLLGDIVRRVSGKPLDEYTAAHVFDPLGMERTTFNPLESLPDDTEYAATERSAYYDDEVVVGEVHDEIAAFRGGVSGHAGLFSSVDDLATFATALLNGGRAAGTRILSPQAVNQMIRTWTADLGGDRGLGWELSEMFGGSADGSPYDKRSFGQNGFTGTSIWFAPRLDAAVITLTNRVHPTRENQAIVSFRPEFHNLIASLLTS